MTTYSITTSKLGSLSYTENEIIHFPKGLLGFENYKQYLLIKKEPTSVFYFLQSIENTDICFALIEPDLFFADYVLESDVLHEYTHHFVIVTQRKNEAEPTANLLGAIIIHKDKQLGWQIISNNNHYSTRHSLQASLVKPLVHSP